MPFEGAVVKQRERNNRQEHGKGPKQDPAFPDVDASQDTRKRSEKINRKSNQP